MKSNQITTIIASFILGISFIIGCVVINDEGLGAEQALADKPVMTIEETALYLNLTEEQVMEIIKTEEVYSASGTFTGTRLPYFMVEGEYLFNKEIMLNWLNEATLDKRVYLNKQMK